MTLTFRKFKAFIFTIIAIWESIARMIKVNAAKLVRFLVAMKFPRTIRTCESENIADHRNVSLNDIILL